MLLYRIQHKDTKKFLCQVQWHDGRPRWNTVGAFFRMPDTIAKHLRYLMGEFIEREKDGFPCSTRYAGSEHFPYSPRWDEGRYYFKEKGFKVRKKHLKNYRVVINDVAIKGEKKVKAEYFMKSSKSKGEKP